MERGIAGQDIPAVVFIDGQKLRQDAHRPCPDALQRVIAAIMRGRPSHYNLMHQLRSGVTRPPGDSSKPSPN
jgi:hypothetical protein